MRGFKYGYSVVSVLGVLGTLANLGGGTPLAHAAGSPSPTPSASPSARAAAPAVPTAQWSAKMRELYRTLAALLTDVNSDSRFKDPARRSAIEANARKLSNLAHELGSRTVQPPDADPSIAIFSSLFAGRARQAYLSFKSGNAEYSRELLRGLPGYCIACHTRNATGPDFASLPIEPTADALRGIERGEFFASTRQYDRALKEFGAVIDDPAIAAARPIEWSNAIRYALAIAVRVKQDPVRARAVVEKLLTARNSPYFMRDDAHHWLESIDAWAKEKPRTATSDEGLYAEAVRLLGEAHEAQRYPVDHSADVLYLRASAAVHDLLQLGGDTRHAGEAYLMAGLCYEVLRSFHIGEIQDIYYEACVRTHPHSPVAASCFQRYQQSVFFGYTGSGGTQLPSEERNHLRQLEDLAKPAPAPSAAPRP